VTVQAAPDPETGTDWQPGTGAPLSEKLTVPPAGAGAMVAVKVTGRLAAAGFADEVTVVLVGVAVGTLDKIYQSDIILLGGRIADTTADGKYPDERTE
jgi:hypothetical protein